MDKILEIKRKIRKVIRIGNIIYYWVSIMKEVYNYESWNKSNRDYHLSYLDVSSADGYRNQFSLYEFAVWHSSYGIYQKFSI